MRTLFGDGLQKVIKGITTALELKMVTMEYESEEDTLSVTMKNKIIVNRYRNIIFSPSSISARSGNSFYAVVQRRLMLEDITQ